MLLGISSVTLVSYVIAHYFAQGARYFVSWILCVHAKRPDDDPFLVRDDEKASPSATRDLRERLYHVSESPLVSLECDFREGGVVALTMSRRLA